MEIVASMIWHCILHLMIDFYVSQLFSIKQTSITFTKYQAVITHRTLETKLAIVVKIVKQ